MSSYCDEVVCKEENRVYGSETFLESCLSSPMRGTVKLDLCCVFIEPGFF